MPRTDFTWKVGGAQGEGIDSTGEIFALTAHRLGHFVYAYRHFQSLIKGGHTYYKVRLSDRQRRHRGDDLDLMVAFDQQTIDHGFHEMARGGAIIYDSSEFEAKIPEGRGVTAVGVPLTRIAKDQGMAIMKNMVAIGASAALAGLPTDAFDRFVQDRFGDKGGKIVQANHSALMAGYEFAIGCTSWRAELPPPAHPPDGQGKRRVFMSGNDALALGAVVAGCRLVAAYPITPATEILYSLLKLMPRYGGVVVQAEDEMAACQMAVGANYAGVRAMTTTSGPGLSLMTETLGLSGVSETPLVIVDVQRAGPSTGMPTKTEQGDANTAIYAAHGEIPRIVLAPTTVEECFYGIQRAFNLADRFQCPVIVLSDLVLGLSKMSVEVDDIDFDAVDIDRGLRISDEELARLARHGGYKRYELTESGLSPRALPGQPGGVHIALSYEHDEYGVEMDVPEMRVKQTRKRFRKMSGYRPAAHGLHRFGSTDPDLLFIGWGSTEGILHEVRERLEADGLKVGHLQVSSLHPLPAPELCEAIRSARRVLVVENNFTGQLAELIRKHVGHFDKVSEVRKFNGEPFYVHEICAMAKEVA